MSVVIFYKAWCLFFDSWRRKGSCAKCNLSSQCCFEYPPLASPQSHFYCVESFYGLFGFYSWAQDCNSTQTEVSCSPTWALTFCTRILHSHSKLAWTASNFISLLVVCVCLHQPKSPDYFFWKFCKTLWIKLCSFYRVKSWLLWHLSLTVLFSKYDLADASWRKLHYTLSLLIFQVVV